MPEDADIVDKIRIGSRNFLNERAIEEYGKGTPFEIEYRYEENYFILSTETGEVLFYKSRENFERKLKRLGLFNTFELDYTAFKTSWKYLSNGYHRIDWDDCELTNGRPGG
ncbi:hypothetical protein WH96_18805 [Kiloniella spongiae]|uniref:Uncharacterized protein n=2 Tax=Kiloniella spongiae TaxID=1489064 RepID=A0A0H2M9J3_9PROT|nr:hypothetical protein WH96_18805 [Kiloniella spongiae]